MEMLKKISWELINEYLDKDLLIMQRHPTKDLFILNYSKTCQFERAWDEVTLACRGLVVNGEGTIVARPFSKFFNKEEYEAYDDLPNYPTDEDWVAFTKMDGSLGILFYYDGWEFASRGSFTSEQANKGAEMINRLTPYLHDLNENVTYIFEIIYPENRIVVNYGEAKKLVLLGVIVTSTGEEISYKTVTALYKDKFEIVDIYEDLNDFAEMKAFDWDNEEGFVVKFESGFRMKIKFEEYCRLHSIVTNVSNKIVWEHLKDGKSLEEMLNNVPDEFYDWVEKTKMGLEHDYKSIEKECLLQYVHVQQEMIDAQAFQKKDFAMKVKDHKYSGILFSMWDKKDYSHAIWSLVKPVYSKPFKDGVDEN